MTTADAFPAAALIRRHRALVGRTFLSATLNLRHLGALAAAG
jgi:hypothetical protein